MSYGTLHYGLGAVAFNAAEPWCSPEHPSGSCSPTSGIAKPMTNEALAAFKELQNQLNRVAQVKGWSKTPVDGRIGPLTIALYNKVAGAKGFTPARDHNHLAAGAWTGAAAKWVSDFASSMGAPAYVKPPVWPPSIATKPSASGGMPVDPPASGVMDAVFAMGPIGLIAIGGVGFLGYKMYMGGKPKGGKYPTRRARRDSQRRIRRLPLKAARARRRRTRR